MRVRIAVLSVVVVAVFAACGGDDPSTVGSETSASSTSVVTTAPGSAEHNDADVTFAQMMIPHHQKAVDMAAMAADRAGSAEVLDLAARIEMAQGPEIDTMRGWLTVWGEDEATSGGSDMPMDEGDGNMEMGDSGSGSDSETSVMMTELEAAGDAEFNRRFLELMIEHHGSAIDMAEDEAAEGEYGPAVELASQIIEAQRAEIEEMQALLDQAGG